MIFEQKINSFTAGNGQNLMFIKLHLCRIFITFNFQSNEVHLIL